MKLDPEWKSGEQKVEDAVVDLVAAWKDYNALLAAQDVAWKDFTVFTKEYSDAVVCSIGGRDNVLAKVDALAKLVSP